MKFLDFFAGVGGFRRGMELAGHECVGFCEWDKFATASYISMHCITDEQREYLATLDLKQRQKEILKDEYRNGEWYADDIRRVDAGAIPRADCWCFGFPCQDISIAGKCLGFAGSRSSLFFATTKIIRELADEDRPKLLFIENVKNLLSVNGGFDFARLLIELDDIGYDAEWQVCNSKDFGVPQNRERVFIIGHLRGSSTTAVFPVERGNGENSVHEIGRREGGSLNLRTYAPDGICGTVEGNGGGGHEPNVPVFCEMSFGAGIQMHESADTLLARYYKGPCNQPGTTGVAVPVLTPDRPEKRQNGRRFKDDGDDMFTLTGQDRHGVAVSMNPVGGAKVGMSDQFSDRPEQILDGAANALTTKGDNAVALKVKDGTKQGYAIAHEGDGITLTRPEDDSHRGRVGGGAWRIHLARPAIKGQWLESMMT